MQEEIPRSLIAEISYDTPTRKDLAVCFAFFNYTGSSRLIMNYLYVVEKLKVAKIPFFTIELVIEGYQPCINDALHVYGKSFLFQKENLCRILETKIPLKFTKLLFLDADIIFDSPGWYDMLSNLLDTNEVCHCFETVQTLDISYKKIITTAKSLVKVNGKTDIMGYSRYHCGYGWAFQRNWYNKYGFLDVAILGSGDAFFAYAIFGIKFEGHAIAKSKIYNNAISNWLDDTRLPSVTFLPVNAYHMFHGNANSRQYVKRHSLLEKYSNIEDAIVKNKYNVYELTDASYNQMLYEYFTTRMDDSVE
jgi:hypothetical protein